MYRMAGIRRVQIIESNLEARQTLRALSTEQYFNSRFTDIDSLYLSAI